MILYKINVIIKIYFLTSIFYSMFRNFNKIIFLFKFKFYAFFWIDLKYFIFIFQISIQYDIFLKKYTIMHKLYKK